MSTSTEAMEARGHHPLSPSTLQNREVCPCYEGRQTQHVRSIAGTLAHSVVETRTDNNELGDEDAAAAAECMDFVDARKRFMEQTRESRIGVQEAAIKDFSVIKPEDLVAMLVRIKEINPEILEVKEEYLPVDDCIFGGLDPEEKSEYTGTTAGYVDHILLDIGGHYCEMVDYKFGLWEVEPAATNIQGISYVLGVFKRWPDIDTVRFFFKQPLINSLSEAVFKRDEIPSLYLRVQTITARAREARVKIAKDDWSMAVPKIPVCNFCANLGKCPKVLDLALRVGKKFHSVEVPENITPTMVMAPDQTDLCLRLAQIVKIWADAFRAQVTNRVLEGRAQLPSGHVIQSQSRRKLIDKKVFKDIALRYLTLDEYESTLDVVFGAVEKIVSSKAPRGAKESTVKDFQSQLEQAGATEKGLPYSFLRAKASKD